jgi:hypothetical protein
MVLSGRTLQGYGTLDFEHVKDIQNMLATITAYVDDPQRKRPLNILMLAAPGAGKSHFIKCIGRKLDAKGVSAITFNMAAMLTSEDLMHPLDAARNMKVADRVPLLFLDEFDSSSSNYSLLLPLLWDGELHLGHRDLKLGKVVIVLAGSDPRLPSTMEEARSMQLHVPGQKTTGDGTGKLVDLLSRINGGVFQLPGLEIQEPDRDRRVDKICIAASLLQERFGRQLVEVPRALLRFIGLSNFRYGVRSIAHLIESIPALKDKPERLDLAKLRLPLGSVTSLKKSSLAYHLASEDQAHGVFNLWRTASADKSYVRLDAPIDELFREFVVAHGRVNPSGRRGK